MFRIFRKRREPSVTEILEMADITPRFTTVAGRRFQVLWAVSNADDGFKTVRDGFTTKADCLAYCETVSFNWYIIPYSVEV